VRAEALIRVEERVDLGNVRAAARAAAALFDRLHSRADVRAALGSGQVHYEVPFSFAPPDEPDTIVRGVIDCLIVPSSGPPVVLEFKTGVERPEHIRQVERYGAAVRAFLAVDRVEIKILYA